MNLTNYSWWQLPIKKPRSMFDSHCVMGIKCFNFDGRDDYYLTADGSGLFFSENFFRTEPIYKGQDSPQFQELRQWLHIEEWLWWVEDEMQSYMCRHCEANNLDESDENVVFRDIDEASEWLPRVVPELFAKQLPTADKVKELAIAYYFNKTLPTNL